MNLLDPQARKYYQNYGPKFQINGQGFFTTEFLKKTNERAWFRTEKAGSETLIILMAKEMSDR